MTENRAALQAEANANLPDNTTGAITPALVRQMILDMLSNMPTLSDTDTFAATKTFAVPPILTGLSGLVQANGAGAVTALTSVQARALIGAAKLVFTATGVNLNALADSALAITLPTGFTRYKISELHISNASISLTTAQIGLYTAASQGGVNIVAQTLTGITQTATDTNPNTFSATIINQGTRSYNDATLYFNVGTVQGAAATADVTIIITPLP